MRSIATNERGKYVDLVLTGEKLKLCSIGREQEMMVTHDSGFTDKQPTTTGKFVLAVNPDIECLTRFATVQSYVH